MNMLPKNDWLKKTYYWTDMWYHPLDTLKKNSVTENQKKLGWNTIERRKLFEFYYFHKIEKVPDVPRGANVNK